LKSKEIIHMSRKFFALATGVLALSTWAMAGSALADDVVVVQACGQACGQGGCCRDRGCPHGGVCVPTTETKKIDKRVYTDICEQFCVPKCSLLGFLRGGGCDSDCENGSCHDGNCHQCEHPRTRKYLVVKIKHEEECVPACKVEQGCCTAPSGTIQPVPAKAMPPAKTASAGQTTLPLQVLEYRTLPMPKR
jgi:hypothetical protein